MKNALILFMSTLPILVGCSSLTHNIVESMNNTERQAWLAKQNIQTLCSGYNNTNLGTKTEQDLRKILIQKGVTECTSRGVTRLVISPQYELPHLNRASSNSAPFSEMAVKIKPTGISDIGSYYVTAAKLNVRLAPSKNAKITNKIYRQNRVDVMEVRGGWARISRYYDGEVEGLPGKVARWVTTVYLSKQRPADKPQPKLVNDPRIEGLPKVGEYGLTKKDVLILRRGAQHFLKTRRCDQIEYGDKSVNKSNTYYVNCGGSRNLFFKPSDLPKG